MDRARPKRAFTKISQPLERVNSLCPWHSTEHCWSLAAHQHFQQNSAVFLGFSEVSPGVEGLAVGGGTG